jgi:hypothetical protein
MCIVHESSDSSSFRMWAGEAFSTCFVAFLLPILWYFADPENLYRRLTSHIDPIDLEFIKPLVDVARSRAYQRASVVTGPLIQLRRLHLKGGAGSTSLPKPINILPVRKNTMRAHSKSGNQSYFPCFFVLTRQSLVRRCAPPCRALGFYQRWIHGMS